MTTFCYLCIKIAYAELCDHTILGFDSVFGRLNVFPTALKVISAVCLVFIAVVAWYRQAGHFQHWLNAEEALRPFPSGSNTMSLAHSREPSHSSFRFVTRHPCNITLPQSVTERGSDCAR